MASETPSLEKAVGEPRENQLRFVVNVALQKWVMILCFTVGGSVLFGILGLAYANWKQPWTNWKANTQLIVRKSAYDRPIFQDIGGPQLFRTSPNTLAKIIHRRDVAEDVTRALVQEELRRGRISRMTGVVATEEEYHSKISHIAGKFEIKPDEQAGLIDIIGHGPTEEVARRVTEYAARAFIKRHQRLLITEEQDLYDFLQSQIEDVGKRLDEAESAEWQFRKEMGFRTYDRFEEDMKRMNEELVRADVTGEEIQAKLAEIEDELKENNEKLPAALGQVNDVVVTQLMADLNELLQRQLTMGVVYQADFEPLRILQDEIAEKQQAILVAVSQLDGGMGSGQSVWSRRQSLRNQYVQLQLELTSMDIRTATIEKMLNEMVEQWPELTARSKEYHRLVRNADQLRGQFNRLIDKRVQIEEAIRRGAAPLERHTAVSDPEPTTPAQPVRRRLNFLVGALAGFLTGLLTAIFIEMMDTSIRGVEDVTDYIGLEVIGTIPRMRFGKPHGRRARGNFVPIKDEHDVDACIVTQHDPKSPISEAYRALRTNFQFATIKDKAKTVMVTSPVPGEGKTTTAVNMAVTFADTGLRVLLVDTDLRRPHVHHVLKTTRGPGLADVLREGIDFNTLIRQTQVKNLWSISSGHVPPNPSELIGSAALREVMRQMREQFDLVICDTPSILVVTDPVLLATNMDAVVIVVSAGYARRETVLRARKLMATAQANIAGVVLNGIEATRRHYYYYYYYYDDGSASRRGRWVHV